MSFALFDACPELSARLPRAPLGTFPTPVTPATGLAGALGVASADVWLKRDDISAAAYGGNKVRTLELLFGQARVLGKERVFSTGAFGSNHALATAFHAARCELRPGALLFPQPISFAAYENLRALSALDVELRAIAHWSALPFGIWRLKKRAGASAPYVMVPGGATPLGALGYVSAGLELARQIADKELPLPRRIVVGVGSTCTSAGLCVGLTLAATRGLGFTRATQPELCSVRVTPWPITSRFRILRLATAASRLLCTLSGGTLPQFSGSELSRRFDVDGRFLGSGYGLPTDAGREAIALWSQLGLPALDTTYSAKAVARVLADTRAGSPGPVLFWSTKSSVPLPAQTPLRADLPPRVARWLKRAERELAPGAD
ncbi:MAG TPA: pyridoxal-phosphate dependent enzyme [Polyangiaceae bacterium]